MLLGQYLGHPVPERRKMDAVIEGWEPEKDCETPEAA